MKICLLLLLTVCSIKFLSAEYPRIMRRGPPLPPRAPPPPQYAKKWQQPHHHHHHHQKQQPPPPPHMHMPPQNHGNRGPPPTRRPIPVQMPTSHQIPMGVAPAASRPVANPVRVFWKNTQTTFRTPVEKPYVQKQQKPFLAAPAIQAQAQAQAQAQEYDYQIQTNSIPTHTNPIKQIGEKGPIHTIPAPNLSLADKPHVIENVKHKVPESNYLKQQHHAKKAHHQYQVTEVIEHQPQQKLYGAQSQQQQGQQLYFVAEQDMGSLQNQNIQFQTAQSLQAPAIASIQGQNQLLQAPALSLQSGLQVPQTEYYYNIQNQPSVHLDQKDLYQLLSTYPQQQQQQLLEAYQLPNIQTQQSQIQQAFLQQPLKSANHHETSYMQHAQQSDLSYSQQIQNNTPQNNPVHFDNEFGQKIQEAAQAAADKLSQPEYHSFNYDEQSNKRNQGQHTFNYEEPEERHSRDPGQQESQYESHSFDMDQDVGSSESILSRSSLDALAQSQYVQKYFDNREDGDAGNDVEPDAKPSSDSNQGSQANTRPGEITGAYYSTLPNKQAADALASLQAAGKINSNLMQLSRQNTQLLNSKTPMTIYVPDDIQEQESQQKHNNNNSKKNDKDSAENANSEEKMDDQEYADDYSQEEDMLDDKSTEIKSEAFGHRLKPKKNEH